MQTADEKEVLTDIKYQINSIINRKILEKKLREKSAKSVLEIEKESEEEFFNDLTRKLENDVADMDLFLRQLEIDHPKILEKIKVKIAPVKTLNDLLLLPTPNTLLDKSDIHDLYALGLDWFYQEAYERAFLYFSFLAFVEPKNSDIWFIKGNVEQRLGKLKEALMSYYRTIHLNPTHLLPYIHIMETLIQLKQLELALKSYNAFIQEVDPSIYAKNESLKKQLASIKNAFEVEDEH